ncbi:MAG: heme lyase CcmF/NrfE family subunit [Alphaproteobacteria bacterium]|nr:heme lyase CcmF/NrfE family subunit [Alphaproteobacteria bacterium]
MIAELGHFALVMALIAAVVQGSVPMVGAARGDAAWMAVARPAALGQLAGIALAFAALIWSYVTSDFSVMNVAQNSNSMQPLLYKFTSAWGNHEGSMVLWVLILAVYGACVALFGANLPPALRARVLGVQGWIAIGFLLFILFTSNPFLRVIPPPADGRDLNPLLQDIGLAIHPPFLYLGYVGFSMAFSFAVAALIEGRIDAAWARWVRPWTLLAWCFLTCGIAMGSYWAYYELGWGGWWFWDPVENASFMPWLVGTALLHSATVVEKRDAMKSWTILLAIIAFSLSLMGTFLVRSGVLTSVHAFATDPARGIFILVLLALTTGGALTLYAIRAPSLKTGGLFAPISREGSLVLNNLLLATATATVLFGTLYPLLSDVTGGDKLSVGAPYFNLTFVPIMVPLIAAMAVGPLLSWKRGDLKGALQRLMAAFAISVAVALATLYLARGGPVLAALGLALAAWLFFGTLTEFAERIRLFRAPLGDSIQRAAGLPRSAYGMLIAHAGMAFTVAGITATAAWESESIQNMKPGDRARLSGYEFTLVGVRQGIQGPNYTAEQAGIVVSRDGRDLTVLEPAKRFYPVQRQATNETAIATLGFTDIYAALGEGNPQAGWTVRLYHKPLVTWIWLGAALMAVGGVVSLSDRRFRIGAPARARRPAAGAADAAVGD